MASIPLLSTDRQFFDQKMQALGYGAVEEEETKRYHAFYRKVTYGQEVGWLGSCLGQQGGQEVQYFKDKETTEDALCADFQNLGLNYINLAERCSTFLTGKQLVSCLPHKYLPLELPNSEFKGFLFFKRGKLEFPQYVATSDAATGKTLEMQQLNQAARAYCQNMVEIWERAEPLSDSYFYEVLSV